MKKLTYALYELKSFLNFPKRQGALLKWAFKEGQIGYADCHPWPELGDLPLKEQLEQLKQGQMTPLTTCSLAFARLDAEARSQNQNLLQPLKIPASHFFIPDFLSYQLKDLQRLEEQTYTHVKVKVGRHPKQEIAHLLELFSQSHLKLRLDFNEKLFFKSFRDYLMALEPIWHAIDFIEDPFPFDTEKWRFFNRLVPLACDRKAEAALVNTTFPFLVLKPAIQSEKVFKQVPKGRVIVTSYLDHPLGQMAAAYRAAIYGTLAKPHGLLSHHTYERNDFSHYLAWDGPHFKSPPGTGFGFDEELNKLDWKGLE